MRCSDGYGYSLFLTDSGAVLSLGEGSFAAQSRGPIADGGPRVIKPAMHQVAIPDVVRLELIGTSHPTQAEAESRLPGIVSYFIGNDPAEWRSNIPTYARVKYQSVYPGIDLVYYGNQGRLEYDFAVAPGADANSIRFRLSGAKHLAIDRAGNIRIKGRNGSLQVDSPVVYQEKNGVRRRIDGRFRRIGADAMGFQLGKYNRALPLTIDPVLIYSTYLGGSDDNNGLVGDVATAIAVDATGNAYLTGTAISYDFPVTQGAFQSTNKAASITGGIFAYSSGTAFVSKLNADGTALVYSTYLGGSVFDHGKSIAVDGSGNAYIAGNTDSTDFPVTAHAVQPKNNASGSNGLNGFVTKLNATGTTLVYSTYLGGSGVPTGLTGNQDGDSANAIAVDDKGNAYVASLVESKDFPVTQDAFQPFNRTVPSDGLTMAVTKLNPEGTAFVYSTYLGGSGSPYTNPPNGDVVGGIAVDGSGNTYLAGLTGSLDFPVTSGAFQMSPKAPSIPTAFVAKLNASGSGLVYSTYLGGSSFDQANAIALNSTGNAYIAGWTSSADFPVTKGALQTISKTAGGATGFVTKLNSDGSALVYSTFLGGSIEDYIYGIAVDSSNDAYVVGSTSSWDFPITAGALIEILPSDQSQGSRETGFLARLNPAGGALQYGTYLGGSFQDQVNAVANARSGIAAVTGSANSSNFPVTSGAFQDADNGCQSWTYGDHGCDTNAFVTKLDTGVLVTRPATKLILSSSANPAILGTNITITATVSASGSNAIPSGYVLFTVDGLLQRGSEPPPQTSSRTVSWTISSLASGKHTITAQFRSSGYELSSATEVLTVEALPAPVISPAGGTFSAPQSVSITAYKGAFILYTTDGSTPTIDSTIYRGPVTVASNEMLQAIALLAGESGNILSSVSSAAFSVTGAGEPVFSPAAGVYTAAQSVAISDVTPGAAIYYTLNGSTPSTQSTKYTGKIAIDKNTTVKAIAVASGFVASPVASATYAFGAALTYPLPNSVLPGPKVTFSWSAFPGATSYVLRLGTSVGANDLFGTGPITATSVTVTNLPANGKTICARLLTNVGSYQSYADYTLTAAIPAALTAPTPSTVLAGPKATFAWSASTGAVTSYVLRLGTWTGANNLYGSGPITATSATVTSLPTNGETVYARLYTNYASGAQEYSDYTFTAAP